MVFMPHGENLILVMENYVPVKAIMKDITEEIALFREDATLPEKVKRIYAPTAKNVKLLSIFTDVFDCFFRFMAHILVEHAEYSEVYFWEQVVTCIHEYHQEHIYLQDKFEQYDLFAPEFIRSCLNRLQLKDNRQMVDLSNPNGSLQFIGTLENPVAMFRNAEKVPQISRIYTE